MVERRSPVLGYLRTLTPREATSARRRIKKAVFLLGIGWAGARQYPLSVESISEVCGIMLDCGSSPAAINNILADLRGVAQVAHGMGEMSGAELAAVEAVPYVPDPKREPRLLAGWEISAVISACVREGTAKGARDAALISLTYAGGLTPGVATDLETKDWRADKDLLRAGSDGTDSGRPIPLAEDAAGLFRRWIALRGSSLRGTDTKQLFLAVDKSDRVQSRPLGPPAIGAILNGWADKARVRRFSYKDLRRTAAADMLAGGGRTSEIRRILGDPVPEFGPEVLADRNAMAGPRLRAVRLGSEHLDYFDVVGRSYGRFIPSATLPAESEGEEPEWPDPFADHLADRVQTPSGTVAFGAIGEGPPVVLVHGTPWNSFCWRHVAPKLADSHSVHAYDLPGHGESEQKEGQDFSLAAQAKVLAWLIGEWRKEEPGVVAHGVGAAIALRAHLLERVAFRKLVLVDPAVTGSWLSPAGRHIKKHPEAYRSMPADLFQATLKARLEADIRLSTGRVPLRPYLLQWRGREGRLAYVRMAEQLEEAHTAELEQHLGSIETPLLILAGDTDAAPITTSALRMYQAVPGARLGRIPWSGPFLPEEAPEELTHALSCFIS